MAILVPVVVMQRLPVVVLVLDFPAEDEGPSQEQTVGSDFAAEADPLSAQARRGWIGVVGGG